MQLFSGKHATASVAIQICLMSYLGFPNLPVIANDRTYETLVKPVFVERCIACHGALKQEAGLRLDTASFAIKGGESGAAIVPSETRSSPILDRVTTGDMSVRMPPEGEPLKVEQISNLRRWIEQGATAPENEIAESSPSDHWAFQPPTRPNISNIDVSTTGQASDSSESINPIDVLLTQARRARGLKPQRPADRRVWLRRVSFDLVGLPPTLEEQAQFLGDHSVDAYDQVVDRLLASPHYGERWGRHWMDVWRYSDWWGLGAEVRNSQKHMWHWRDWIIESLNSDKGYDQMVREMIASDELYPNDLEKLRASGFLARQYFRFNRTSWLDETVEHTSKAIMGLTMNCAKCHDHKYDPIRHQDYYRMRAIFEPYQVRIDFTPNEIDPERDGIPRAFDCNLEALTYLHVRGDDRNPDTSKTIPPSVPEFLLVQSARNGIDALASFHVNEVVLPREAREPGFRSFIEQSYLVAADRKIVTAKQKLAEIDTKLKSPETASMSPEALKLQELEREVASKSLASSEAARNAIPARAFSQKVGRDKPDSDEFKQAAREAVRLERLVLLADSEISISQSQLELAQATGDKLADAEKKVAAAMEAVTKIRQSVDEPSEQFTPLSGSLKTPESNLESDESRRRSFPPTSTGRRSALANWLTHAQNPLTARVAVNHLWLRHMGRPIVPTVFDFGRKGKLPSHPELLDWLATELVENQWSMKHIHRLIVTSEAYQMSSSSLHADAETVRNDPENQFYWRANPIRMESQSIRDALLHLANVLDPTLGGPSIPASDEQSLRRSIYFFHSHNEHNKFLSMFDDASVLDCYRRAESIVPQQALALENSPLATEMSQKIADRIVRDLSIDGQSVHDDAFVTRAFHLVLSTEPNADEIMAAQRSLTRWRELSNKLNKPNSDPTARANLVQALLNHNDFVTIR